MPSFHYTVEALLSPRGAYLILDTLEGGLLERVLISLCPRPQFRKGKGLCNSRRFLVQQFSPDSGENYYASYKLCIAMEETMEETNGVWR